MFNTLLNFIINIIITLASSIAGMITWPLFTLLNLLFPDFNLYFDTFNIFVQNYVLKGIAFFRECFFNLTGYPRGLFNALLAMFLFRITYHTSVIIFKFVINMYSIIRGKIVNIH